MKLLHFSWKSFVDNFIGWKKVTISAERADVFENFSSLTRTVPAMKICGDFTIGSRFINLTTFLRQAGADFTGKVKILEFKSMTIRVKVLASILRLFLNLEEVELVCVKNPADDSDTVLTDVEKPALTKLKKLVFRAESGSVFLLCFEKSRISNIEAINQTFDPQEISRFLAQQPDLNDLEFCRLASHQLCLTAIVPENIPFKLKRLALDYVSMNDFEQVINLLSLQMPLDTLEVGHIPDFFYEFIFTSLGDLETLHLMPGCVARSRFSISLRENTKITTLRLYNGVRCGLDPQKIREVAIQVINKLPNLETLELLVPYDLNFFNAIEASCKKLKNLTIFIPFHAKLNRLKVPPTIENLRVKCFNCRQLWEQEQHSLSHEQVKSLIFEGVTNKNVLKVIGKIFPNLESLELRKKLAEDEYDNFMNEKEMPIIRGVKYRDEDFFFQKFRF